jgi:hypothetical protein
MTLKQLESVIQNAKDTLQAAKYKFPTITNMEIEIKGIEQDTLKLYSEKNGMNIRFSEYGWNHVNIELLKENGCESKIILTSKIKYQSEI